LAGIRQFNPMVIQGKRRLVYCSPITDKQAGHVGYDVIMLEEGTLQAVIDAGDASNIDIMFLFVTEEERNILFQPASEEGLPSQESLRKHLAHGRELPGFIIRSQQLSDSQWQVHAVVNEQLFFAEIRQQMMVLASVVLLVMVIVFVLTVIVLRPIIRSLLRQAELIEISHRDGLTGLYNHAFMKEQLETELQRAIRAERAMAVVMFDIDHFKQVNDAHGHLAGDQVLRQVASLANKCLRSGDSVARYGGEEFMLILPDTAREGALMGAERLRRMVAEEAFDIENATLRVTISAGIACYTPGRHTSAQELVKAADSALYTSKRTGRNKVSITTTVAKPLRATAQA
jgi:diguanylate cyclase (GGDEF)-like protein